MQTAVEDEEVEDPNDLVFITSDYFNIVISPREWDKLTQCYLDNGEDSNLIRILSVNPHGRYN
jgi:hypothetical protein